MPMTVTVMPALTLIWVAEAVEQAALPMLLAIFLVTFSAEAVAVVAVVALVLKSIAVLICATTLKLAWSKLRTGLIPLFVCPPGMSVILATGRALSQAPHRPPAVLAAGMAKCACNKVFLAFSKPAPSATVAARSSLNHVRLALVPVVSSVTRLWK